MLLGLATVVIFVFVLFLAFTSKKGPDLSKYQAIRNPAIQSMPDQRMLVVTVQGDPNLTGRGPLNALISSYYKIRRTQKDMGRFSLRARWQASLSKPKDFWTGEFGIPIPPSVDDRTLSAAGADQKVSIKQWTYGEIAEVLYIGPYDKEPPSIEKLLAFVDSSGYDIAGDHEEEYLRGPTMFGKGDPAKYVTIIRYCVKKKQIIGDR